MVGIFIDFSFRIKSVDCDHGIVTMIFCPKSKQGAQKKKVKTIKVDFIMA
jgi:hypothetical protein